MRQALWVGLAVLTLAFLANPRLLAQNQPQTETHEGKVVSVSGQNLVMTMKGETKEHTHVIARDAQITLDGKAVTAQDLKPGMTIMVTTPKGDLKTVTKVQAFSR